MGKAAAQFCAAEAQGWVTGSEGASWRPSSEQALRHGWEMDRREGVQRQRTSPEQEGQGRTACAVTTYLECDRVQEVRMRLQTKMEIAQDASG